MIHDIHSEDLRSIILNAHKIRELNKCSTCEGTGKENWNEDGEDIKPGTSYAPGRETESCQACDGIGYRDITMYGEE